MPTDARYSSVAVITLNSAISSLAMIKALESL